jgi:uncharacterized protein (TIGR03118 family)
VAYAVQNAAKADEVAGVGNGRIDVFDTKGSFVRTLLQGDLLDAPWGMAIAPATFCNQTANQLIVGNFGDGTILAIDPTTGRMLGQLIGTDGRVLVIPGLWALAFSTDQDVGQANALYFTAGGADEAHGVFGYLMPATQH